MSDFLMPSLGSDMEAGTLVEWLKRPGEALRRGDVIAVVETQKGAIEIEVFEDGTLGEILVEPGTKVPVGTPLARIEGAEGEAEKVEEAETREPPPPAEKAKPLPERESAPPPPPPPAGGTGKVSPAARKRAAELGLDLAALEVEGSGPGGAVVSADIERLAGGRPAPPQREEAVAGRKGPDLQAMRQAMGAALARSKREIPHFYLSHDIDLTQAVEWLRRVNETRPPAKRLLLGALLLRAVVKALERAPEFNGWFEEGAFRQSAAVQLGVAIAIRGGGLISPAIRDAEKLNLNQTMEALRDLTARARANRLRSSELSEASITVSSLGERGVDGLFGIIYPPQVALVGFGAPSARPWAVDGALAVRQVVTASLAADHRVSDGHRGGLFLAEIASQLAKPEAL